MPCSTAFRKAHRLYLLDKVIECKSRSERIEIYPFYDMHVGKRNFAETPFVKQRAEILRRSQMPDRQVFVLLGGDLVNAINTADIRRFDFDELADWFIVPSAAEMAKGSTSRDMATIIRNKLNNIGQQEVDKAVELLEPIKHLIIGAIYGNHEKTMRTKQNVDVHSAYCERLGIVGMTDEALIRLRFRRMVGKKKYPSKHVIIYMRHGYGGGRTAGAEPNKLQRMVDEWECADVCLTGHSHSYCILPPKPVPFIPSQGRLPVNDLLYKYRFGANPGTWLFSHLPGPGSYESSACYPARPMMTLKIVIWPFWSSIRQGQQVEIPKVELREYPIL